MPRDASSLTEKSFTGLITCYSFPRCVKSLSISEVLFCLFSLQHQNEENIVGFIIFVRREGELGGGGCLVLASSGLWKRVSLTRMLRMSGEDAVLDSLTSAQFTPPRIALPLAPIKIISFHSLPSSSPVPTVLSPTTISPIPYALPFPLTPTQFPSLKLFPPTRSPH